MATLAGCLLLAACLLLPTVSARGDGDVPAPSAQRQIRALLDDKARLTSAQRKLDTRLLMAVRQQRRDPALDALPHLETGLTLEAGGFTVDLRAEVSPGLLERIVELGGRVVSAFPRWKAVRAVVPADRVEALAAHGAVRNIRPADEMMVHGNVVLGNLVLGNTVITEGDVAHRADVGRADFGVDGTGVMACAMSDSVDALAALQASGELPAGVLVLAGQSGNPASSEGTALLEIIHDMAPGAALAFATGSGGTAQMAQNILDLQAAGCDVIVDDVFYLSEPPFQDGVIAQAVEQVVAAGALYFSSAGNSGRLNAGVSGVWEGDYSGAAAVPAPLVGAVESVHDFGGGLSGNQITEDALNDAPFFTLWWSDPLGAAGNDYDLFLLDDALANVVAFSTATQDGGDDPFGAINAIGLDHTDNRLVVARFNGDDRFLQLNTHRGRLEDGTNGQITGHAGAVSAIAVAAVNVATAGGEPFTGGAANPVQTFSSDGPRRIFFNADGSPVAPLAALGDGGGQTSVVRPKPDISAADGVSTTTPGFETFFGTSASAPHSAAIGALLRQLDPDLTSAELFDLFPSGVLDIEDPGFDTDSGFGLIEARVILQEAEPADIFADGFESGDATSWTDQVP